MPITLRPLTPEEYAQAQLMTRAMHPAEELPFALKNKSANIWAVRQENSLVGLALMQKGRNGLLTVFVEPSARNRGIGTEAANQCEAMLRGANCQKITAVSRADAPESTLFARKLGYRRGFSSACMEYSGPCFPLGTQLVRPYRREDYDQAHALYARAFHEMRVRVGDFPDSVIEQPSEKMCRAWAETAEERLIYLHENHIVGYAHLEGNEIASVSVQPEMQGRGIGRAFVKYLCNHILCAGNQSVSLFCVTGNRARDLYESLSFVEQFIADYSMKVLA